MKAIGSRIARAANRVFRRSGPVLADRYHLHVLRTPSEVRNALAYVLLNAPKHAARAGRALARAFTIDPASSGRWFDGCGTRVSHRVSHLRSLRRAAGCSRSAGDKADSWILTKFPAAEGSALD